MDLRKCICDGNLTSSFTCPQLFASIYLMPMTTSPIDIESHFHIIFFKRTICPSPHIHTYTPLVMMTIPPICYYVFNQIIPCIVFDSGIQLNIVNKTR